MVAVADCKCGGTLMNNETMQSECELMTSALLNAVEKVIAKDVCAEQADEIRELCTTFVRRSTRTEKARTGRARQTSRLVRDEWATLGVRVLDWGGAAC